MHWPAPGVDSISRKSAFISSGLSARPDRTECRQANAPSQRSSRRARLCGAVVGREVGGEIAHEGDEIALRDDRGRFAHHDRAGAEALDDKAEPGEFVGVRFDERRRVRVEIDDERGHERLPLDRASIALALELLVDDALVRRVLSTMTSPSLVCAMM